MNKRKTDIVRSSSHRKEDKSKRAFEELIDPWTNQGWNPRDYGIDTVVEIFSSIRGSDDFRAESKYFLTQLKATKKEKLTDDSISISVPVKKIIYWYGSNVPVLFVVNHLTDNKFYGIWIDDGIINHLEIEKPGWINKKTVSIRLTFNNLITHESKPRIQDYVQNWKAPNKKLIEPGKFFDLKSVNKSILDEYNSIASRFCFESIDSAINSFYLEVDRAIYRIAITGLSRVGKSSLINTFLDSGKTEISPTGFFQTTGVPIQILPWKENKIVIQFQNGKQMEEAYSFEVIEQYASQEFNEDNKKGVSLLTINLCNYQLERGVSLYDIPGLDDPDDDILEYTWNTVKKSNAVVYVIDGSPAEHGGFIFKNEYKRHINDLGASLDKIFLVFNKIEVLSSHKLQLLKERVNKDLKKLELYDKISHKIYYLSAENNKTHKGLDTVEKLRADIWSYLLRENNYGLARLSLVNQEMEKSLRDFADILQTRLLDNKKRKKLEVALEEVNEKIPHISDKLYNEKLKIKRHLFQSLENRRYNILHNLELTLENLPKNNPLPKSRVLKKFLSQGISDAIENTNKEYTNYVNNLKEDTDEWIENHLKLVREIISSNREKGFINFNELEDFQMPKADLSSSLGMGFLGILTGFIINPPAALFVGIIGFFGNLIFSSGSIRSKQIAVVMREAQRRYNKAFIKLKLTYSEGIDENFELIRNYVNSKLKLYFNDLHEQMQKLDQPLSESDIELYNSAFQKIDKINDRLIQHETLIQQYYSGISRPKNSVIST